MNSELERYEKEFVENYDGEWILSITPLFAFFILLQTHEKLFGRNYLFYCIFGIIGSLISLFSHCLTAH